MRNPSPPFLSLLWNAVYARSITRSSTQLPDPSGSGWALSEVSPAQQRTKGTC